MSSDGSRTHSARSLRLIGDDLSGSTEALAAALRAARPRPAGWVHLHAHVSARFAHNAAWQALDLDVRQAPPDVARSRYRQALLGTSGVTALKVDSLLRGNVTAAFAEVTPGPGRPVVFAPALPAQGRRTVAGQVVLDDPAATPGALEGARTDAVAVVGRPAALISLREVRSARLATRLRDFADHGVVAVCDAETDEDLDLVAAAALAHPDPVVVGAAGVIAAVARHLSPEPAYADDGCPGQRSQVLVVVGTAESRAGQQVDILAAHGLPVTSLSDNELVERVHAALATGTAVLRAPRSQQSASRSAPILTTLVDVTTRVVREHPDVSLMLTGGATARAVLDRLDVSSLRLCCQVHPGAAHLTTDDGRAVVIRPGSHGAADSLVRIVDHLGGLPDTARPPAPHNAALPMKGPL